MTQLALAQEAVEMSSATLAKFRHEDEWQRLGIGRRRKPCHGYPSIVDETVPFQPAGNPIMAEQKAAVAQSAAQLSAD